MDIYVLQNCFEKLLLTSEVYQTKLLSVVRALLLYFNLVLEPAYYFDNLAESSMIHGGVDFHSVNADWQPVSLTFGYFMFVMRYPVGYG